LRDLWGDVVATVAKIKCGSCSRKFVYYFSLRKPGDVYTCPFCLARMDNETAHAFRNVMGRFADLNMELREGGVQFDLLEIPEE